MTGTHGSITGLTAWRNRITGYDSIAPQTLTANPANFRRHPQAQADALSGALNELGWLQDVVVNRTTGLILDGHLRVELALKHNEPSVPVKYVELSEAEEHLALATLDAITGQATIDPQALMALLGRIEMTAMEDDGLLALLGQMGAEASKALPREAVDAEPQIDRAEELAEKWQTAPGQIWRIAQHVVICGDCREPETWRRLLFAAGVDEVNGVFTSPPYAEQRKEQYGGTPADEYVDWWEAVQGNVKANLADDGSFFVNIKPHCEDGQRVLYVMDLVCAMVRRWGWLYVDEFSWTRNPPPGNWPNRFKNAFEPVYHFAHGACIFRPSNVSEKTSGHSEHDKPNSTTGTYYNNLDISWEESRPSNVLDIKAAAGADNLTHAAAFPVALPDFFVRAYSDPGDIWLDPFLGSGTTIVAAHQNERVGLGMEMLPKYVGVILERLQTVTEQTPHLLEGR